MTVYVSLSIKPLIELQIFSNLHLINEIVMYPEARKLYLIEEMLKLKNEAILIELEAVFTKHKQEEKDAKPTAHDFLRIWSKEDAVLIDRAIEEGCEQIHPDDWKS